MNKLSADRAITDYESLKKEQQRLKELLQIQRQVIRDDIERIKYEFNPAVRVLAAISKFTHREPDANPLLRISTNATIDWAAKRVLTANPVLRFIVPYLIKNYSSHYLNKAVPFLEKIRNKLFRRKSQSTDERLASSTGETSLRN